MTSLAVRPRLFTVEDVDRMTAAGILGPDDRIELIDGELFEVSPQGPLHMALKDLLRERLTHAYREIAYVRDQGPVDLSQRSRPEPDIAVYRGSARDYLARHPRGKDALLVIEVAYSSQEFDRAKALLYAAAGVPVYWILDLVARRLDIHEGPHGDTYARVTSLDDTGEVSPPGLDIRWKIADLLP
jgi:Uma2 family endonuclease